MIRWILIIALGFSAGFIESAFAITFEEYEFRLSEAQRQRNEAVLEIEQLLEELDRMKKDGIPTEERKAYSEALIEVIGYTELLDEEIIELKRLLPEVEIQPVLKLTGIQPEGPPGRFFEDSIMGNLTQASVRFSAFPTEIIAGRPFTISGDSIKRIRFKENVVCHDRPVSPSDRKLQLRISAYPTREPRIDESLSTTVSGRVSLSRRCSDAPVDIDPDNGQKVQAGYEKEDRISFNARFIPQRTSRTEDGYLRYGYKIETMSQGVLVNESPGEVLIAESVMTSGRGSCLDQLGGDCETVLIVLRSDGGTVTLVYQQIMDGQPFLAAAPAYQHPAAFGRPPHVGTIKLATTVPDIIGYTQAEAKFVLEEAQLKINLASSVEPPSADLAGRVSAVSPGVGERIRFGRTVAVTLYSDFLTVPNVVGLSLREARAKLQQNHLEVANISVAAATSAAEEEQIVVQEPAAGNRISPENGVDLVMAGPWVDTREVPSLVGTTLPGARSRLERAGLVPVITVVKASNAREAERIVVQSVPAGTMVDAGTTVRIELAGPFIATADPEPVPPDPDELCQRSFPGSVAASQQNASGDWDCLCRGGKQWNPGKTACVAAAPASPPPRRSGTCDHPWMVLGPDYGGPFPPICECRYGSAINSFACLPPRPAGHSGCPPGTIKEYSMPSRLGLGCECAYGSENRVCIIPEGDSPASSPSPSPSSSGSNCPPGTREQGGTLGQDSTRCVPL